MRVKRAQNDNGLRKIISLSSKQNLKRSPELVWPPCVWSSGPDSYLAVLPARPLSNGPRWCGLHFWQQGARMDRSGQRKNPYFLLKEASKKLQDASAYPVGPKGPHGHTQAQGKMLSLVSFLRGPAPSWSSVSVEEAKNRSWTNNKKSSHFPGF